MSANPNKRRQLAMDSYTTLVKTEEEFKAGDPCCLFVVQDREDLDSDEMPVKHYRMPMSQLPEKTLRFLEDWTKTVKRRQDLPQFRDYECYTACKSSKFYVHPEDDDEHVAERKKELEERMEHDRLLLVIVQGLCKQAERMRFTDLQGEHHFKLVVPFKC